MNANTFYSLPTILVTGLLLSGCSSSTKSASSRPTETDNAALEPRKPRIALVMKSLANEFFSTMSEGAKAHQKTHEGEYELLVNGIKDERDLSRQVALVEEMIASEVDAIVIAPADSKALVPVLRRAKEAGVVIVNIDNRLDVPTLEQEGITIPFVGPDNLAGAKQVGEFLAAKLAPAAEVAILEGIKSSFNSQQRAAGFAEAMTAAGMQVVSSQSAQWEMSQANTIASSILTEHPNLSAILACNDSMALGAIAAVKAAGLDAGANGGVAKVHVVGFDNITAVQQAIRDGQVLATADQHGDQLAVYGIEYALSLVADANAAVVDRETPVDLVTAETLK